METLGNFFRLAFRDASIAVLGIICLIIGLASVLVVAVHLLYLNTFESHIVRSNDVYRVVVDLNSRSTGQPYELAFSADAYAPLLATTYPNQIETIGRLTSFSRAVGFPDGQTRTLDFHFADESILDIFEFGFIHADRLALNAPYSVVVSAAFAERYFGQLNAIGETLMLNDSALTVTGIFADFPRNTHLGFEMVVSSETGRRVFGERFMNRTPWIEFQDTRTYVRLYPGAEVTQLVRDLPNFVDRNIPDTERSLAQQAEFRLGLQPIRRIHIDPREGAFNGVDNSIRVTLISLLVFAITILTLAFVNYLFLSVSRLIRRSREIAIRRVIGASRKDLIVQFIGESALVIIMAFALAVPVVYLIFPIYSFYVGITLLLQDIPFLAVLLFMLLLLLLMTIVAAVFALYVISGDSTADLKGGSYKSAKGLRTFVVGSVFQISLSLILLILTSSIYLHTRDLHNSDLGFDHDGLIVIDIRESPSSATFFNHTELVSELSAGPYIEGLSSTTFHPARTVGFLAWNSTGLLPDESRATGYIIVDENFTDVYGLTLLAGRMLSSENASDLMPSFSAAEGYNALITDYAASTFGFASASDALGARIRSVAGEYTVVGVVDRFRFSSLQGEQNAPGVILASSRPMQYINLRFDQTQESAALAWLEGVLGASPAREEFSYELYRDIEAAVIDSRAEGVSAASISSAMTSLLITIMGFVAVVLFLSSLKSSSTAIRQVLGAGRLESLKPVFKDIGIVLLVSLLISLCAIVFVEALVGSLLGAAAISLWYYVLIAVAVCLSFAALAFVIALVHNRNVLESVFYS